MHPASLFVFLCVGVLMAGWTYHAIAATIISSTVEAPPLQQAATIETPSAGDSFTGAGIVRVIGSCPDSSYVALTINGSFKGAGWCKADGTYAISASLYPGGNTFKVQDYNTTDLAGPTTPTVYVTYTAPTLTSVRGGASANTSTSSGASASSNGAGNTSSAGSSGSAANTNTAQPSTATSDATDVPLSNPLLLTSDFSFHTFTTTQSFTWQLDVEGGTPPYTVHVAWGDGAESTLKLAVDPVFSIQHDYEKPGYYVVVAKSTDSQGSTHIMQLAALITHPDGTAPFLSKASSSGAATSTATSATKTKNPITHMASWTKQHNLLVLAWPSYLVVVLMTASFLLGERREILRKYRAARHVRRPRHAH